MPPIWLPAGREILFTNIYTLSYPSNCSELMQGEDAVY
jgi:hypothetical protein